MIFVVLAIAGSAIGVVVWHLLTNRNAGLDTSGFDMSSMPDPSHPEAPPSFPASAPSAPAAMPPTSLGMVKGDAGMSAVAPAPKAPASTDKTAPASQKSPAKNAKVMKTPHLVGGFRNDGGAKPPDQTQTLSDLMNSEEMKKAMKNQPAPAVSLPGKDKEPAPPNGFTPLGTPR